MATVALGQNCAKLNWLSPIELIAAIQQFILRE